MLTELQIRAVFTRLTLLEQANQRLGVRLNAHAEDIAEQARRIEELEGRLAFFTARHNRITEPAAQERNDLAQRINTLAENGEFLAERLLSQKRRIEQLERLLEKEDTND